LLFALTLGAACGGSGDATYPGLGPVVTGTGGSSSTGTGGSAGHHQDAGSEASVDLPDALTTGGDAGPDSGTTLQSPGLCNPAATWASLDRIDSIAPTTFAQLGGVSGDELSLAYTSTTGDAYVADRASMTTAFDAAARINDVSLSLAVDRVALSPTGMTVVAVAADRHSFVSFERADRGQPWVIGAGLEFTALRMRPEGGAEIHHPVFGGDKRSLFFVQIAFGKATVYESRWDSGQQAWGMASGVGNAELDSPDLVHLRRPTGASADGHTLFFFDEVSGLERAAWRDSPTAPFVFFANIGAFVEATPSPGCDTLYHQRVDDTGIRVFLAD